MTPTAFYFLRDGQTLGPVSKEELEMAAYKKEIGPDTLYTYERARKWYPLSRLIGEVSKLDPQVIEDNLKRYFIIRDREVVGPHSYNELKMMLKLREISHQTLYAIDGASEWRPLAKLPLPRIPKLEVPEGIPHESEWEKNPIASSSETIGGITVTTKIGMCWTDDQHFIWVVHGPKSSVRGQMYMGGPVRRDYLREMLQNGEVQPDTPCAKAGSAEWLTVRDYL
jgi:hypothetical protein